jgi:hypothetical protein
VNSCVIFVTFILFLFVTRHSDSLIAQIIITEIMFDADTLEHHNEFVEIYNLGINSIELSGWKLGDTSEVDLILDSGHGLTLEAQQYAVILDPSYFNNSIIYDNLIPETAVILTIDDASFGSYGWSNTIAESVILMNPVGDTIQVYTYSTGNLPGYSDEKINLSPENQVSNWQNSIIFRGTPGQTNSISPFKIDIAIDTTWLNTPFPQTGHSFQLHAKLKNVGTDTIDYFSVLLFFDYNENSIPDFEEIFHEEDVHLTLLPNEMCEMNWEMAGLELGRYLLGLQCLLDGDENENNNAKILAIDIESSENPVVINEIMFSPVSGQSEWIELYNRSNLDVNLSQWSFADSRDTTIVTQEYRFLRAGDFLILSKDSSVLHQFGISPTTTIFASGFPTLNNDSDDLKLYNHTGRLIDRVVYTAEWMRREVEKGISLERIHPQISSMLADNWAASVDPSGATPTRINSIFVKKPTRESLVNVHPNPFSPDGDGFEDFTIFEYRLPFPTGFLSIDIFDIKGRKIRRLADYQAVGQNGHLIWDGKDGSGRIMRMGIYVLLIRVFEPDNDIFREFKETVVLVKKG